MKKIVGILGMAAMLGSAAFAADPAANFACTKFDGSADFGVKVNLKDTDNVELGMFNDLSASMEFGFVTAGDKTTTGDGVWGELQIGSDEKAYAPTSSIKVPKMNEKGEAVDKDGKVTTDPTKFVLVDVADNAPLTLPAVSVKTAKIHFINGDFALALNIAKPSLKGGKLAVPAATGTTFEAAEIGDDTNMGAGFAIETTLANVFSFNFKFMDKGLAIKAKDQGYGLAFDASLLAVENLSANVLGTFNFTTKYTGFAANAGYKFGITDKMYVKPGVGFTMSKLDKADAVNSLAAGVLFGWGKEEQEPGLDFVPNKTTEGVSVAVGTNLKENGLKLAVGLYDESLLSLLGDDFGTLKTGVEYVMAQKADDTLKVAAKYDVTFSPIYVSVHGGLNMAIPEEGDSTSEYAFGLGIGSKEIIDNTDVYLNYELAGAKDITKNEIKVGTKIHF